LLNKVFHQAIRREIIALIISNEQVSFSRLKSISDVTDGNIFIQLGKLEEAGYIK
jgi:predicted transcriptional regulator